MNSGTILGKFKEQKIEHPESYFLGRGIFLDCRGKLEISKKSSWGWEVMVLTTSHLHNGKLGRVFLRRVTVGPYAWICSRAILYNCQIGRGAIVAAGAVVRNEDVPDFTMVAGNPARVVATFDQETKRWNALRPDIDLDSLTDMGAEE